MRKLVVLLDRLFFRRAGLPNLRQKNPVSVDPDPRRAFSWKEPEDGSGELVADGVLWAETTWWGSATWRSPRSARKMVFHLETFRQCFHDNNRNGTPTDVFWSQVVCTAMHELCHCIQNKYELDDKEDTHGDGFQDLRRRCLALRGTDNRTLFNRNHFSR
ncbi:hypothetical protein QR680_007573 [Steinernema hermaphroditum]|uniref:Uncharacterized protein n=1 Tax=Steinernema hermaphroditum TaxID=289476 RepID=A0AA39IDM5_9BILA|nr:hypothetical protein QR680_007573 [Steinernema hermaphroditum]